MNEQPVELERLTLRLHGANPQDGRLVASLVAAGLAEAPPLEDLSDVRAHVVAAGSAEEIARSIIVELRRSIGTDL